MDLNDLVNTVEVSETDQTANAFLLSEVVTGLANQTVEPAFSEVCNSFTISLGFNYTTSAHI